jgi:hypothetical protein
LVRINRFGSGAVKSALDFFGLDAGQLYIANSNNTKEALEAENLYVKSALDSTVDLDKSEGMIVFSDGIHPRPQVYRKLDEPVYMFYHDTPDNIQVYLDMDGVFADFEGFFKNLFGEERFKNMSSSELWGTHINGMMKGEEEQVFSAFPMLPKAKEMYEFFKPYNPVFLSATGFQNTVRAHAQKRAWLEKHFGPDVKSIFVDTSKWKARYATPNSILIDDRPHSLMPWMEAGGEGLMFRDPDSAIKEFTELYDKVKRRIQDRDKLKL